ncbi:MAG: hypothetical protein AB7T18_19045 [Alphaproteobacteria bacterium]
MKALLLGVAAMQLLAGVAIAGQPFSLTDALMDKVTAGVAPPPRSIILTDPGPNTDQGILITYGDVLCESCSRGSFLDLTVNGVRLVFPPIDLRNITATTIPQP